MELPCQEWRMEIPFHCNHNWEVSVGKLGSGKEERSLRVMGARIRAMALFFDCLVVGVLAKVSPFPELNGEWLPGSLQEGLSVSLWINEFWVFGALFLGLLGLWGVFFEWLLGWTPGKRLLGGKVVSRMGGKSGFFRVLLRNLLKVVFLMGLGIGQLWAFFDSERRTLYDRMTGMMVIRTGKVEAT